MDKYASYSNVYVMINEDGYPTMVVQTEREAIEFHKEDPVKYWDYFIVSYKHHN